jgi:Ca2+-binding EF-hand superfamily protein
MNYKRLKERIRASTGQKVTMQDLVAVLGITEKSLCDKTKGRTQFKADEIDKIRKAYSLTDCDTVEIFINQEEEK